ncbi:hypothetical protein VK792_06935 [Mesobacterium sp. TK19101]|uniref:Monooxygenase n=1 Tax=Mesobacterium hydrothermale TaxID=3111907 RepID=A0ABU6HEX8_9RHOB|nr:hypothetical protein [Mesobacterium sp. TK19101]MEC3861015.1 hypothetical protein [Mesobacterium sp. TK19101]
MIGAVVTYTLPGPMPRAELLERFGKTVDVYRSAPGLLRKTYCYDETTGQGTSFYQFDSLASAQALLNPDFQKGFAERMGATPEIYFTDTLMVVDNTIDSVSTYEQD